MAGLARRPRADQQARRSVAERLEDERPAEVDRAHRPEQVAGRVEHDECAVSIGGRDREIRRPVRAVGHAVADLERLKLGPDRVAAPLADPPLEAVERVRRVPAGAEGRIAHLDDPRPDVGGLRRHRERARGGPHRTGHELVPGKAGVHLRVGRAGAPSEPPDGEARRGKCRERGRRAPPSGHARTIEQRPHGCIGASAHRSAENPQPGSGRERMARSVRTVTLASWQRPSPK